MSDQSMREETPFVDDEIDAPSVYMRFESVV